MIVLAGVIFNLMQELHKIKWKINILLDRRNETTDRNEQQRIDARLEVQRAKLAKWHNEHGYS